MPVPERACLIGQRHSAWLVLGCAMLAAGIDDASAPLQAQTLRPAIRDEAPLARLRPRTTPRPESAPLPVEAEPAAPSARAQARSSSGETLLPDDLPPADQDPETEQPPTGLRPATRDGEPDAGLEPEPVLDGVQAEPEDYRNPDGADPVGWDARAPEEAGAFERPAAGHDAHAFSIELDPLDDRRAYRLFMLEPWEPRGIRVGSFTLFPTVDLGAAWLSNLFRSKPARSDLALELRPSLRVVSNWSTHAAELRATGGFTFLDRFPKEDDRAYALEARGRIDVSRRTALAGSVRREVAQESRGTLDARLRGDLRADVATDEARLTFDHRFNRLAVQLRGAVQSRTFADGLTVDGAAASNRDRNMKSAEEAARLSWTFKPTFLAFADAASNQRRFEAASNDGVRRDSDGERYRVGVGFGTTGQILRGEASIGYGRQTPLDPRLVAIDGMLIDANLTWRMSALSVLLLRGSTDTVETTSLLSSGGFTRRAQAELRHAFMRPLIGMVSIGHAATSYEGIDISEGLTELALGVEYYLGPEAMLFSRYQHAIFRTNTPAGSWDADEVRVGLRLRR